MAIGAIIPPAGAIWKNLLKVVLERTLEVGDDGRSRSRVEEKSPPATCTATPTRNANRGLGKLPSTATTSKLFSFQT